MKKYKTLLFDADNTLLNFDATEDYALKKAFQDHGYPFTEEMQKRYLDINKVLWKAYEDGHLTRDEVIYTRFGRLFKEFHIDDDGIAFENDYQIELGKGHDSIDYAFEILQQLLPVYDLYIVSNGVTATQYTRLRDSGLDQYFKDIFISEEVGFQKPRREFFDVCFSKIQRLDIATTLIIGDSLASDIQGGINAGIDTCWFNPKRIGNTKKLDITYEIKDLRELLKFL